MFAVAMKMTFDKSKFTLEVMVREARVLLRVQHLEQRRRRVAPEVGAQLVDLVEHEHRVARPHAPHPLDDAARQRADVRAAVAADLGLVAHAAQRDADELSSQRPRDRLASDVLPTPGGPTRQRIGPFFPGASLRTARYSRIRFLTF